MKPLLRAPLLTLFFAAVLPGVSIGADDNVTIPKSRLEELERKERELNQLKGDVKKAEQDNLRLKREAEAATAKAVAAVTVPAAPVYTSPPLNSLPPLQADTLVEASDLANYYRTDPSAAEQRFGGKKFILRGEIAGFGKSLVKRSYEVLLKTPDRDTRVICTFYPPDKFNAVYTSNHGAELMAYMGENRVSLARVGQKVTLKAQCRGWHDGAVLVSGAELSSVQ